MAAPYKTGDIFVNNRKDSFDKDIKEFYILATADYCAATGGPRYCLISLMDGNRWTDPSTNIAGVVDGTKFVGRGAKITIDFS
jgi:hypothetical protein